MMIGKTISHYKIIKELGDYPRNPGIRGTEPSDIVPILTSGR